MRWDADMKRKTKIRLWIATIVIGILMIPAGVGWIIYTVTQTGHYDPNAEITDPDTHITSHGIGVVVLGVRAELRRRDPHHGRVARPDVRLVERPRR